MPYVTELGIQLNISSGNGLAQSSIKPSPDSILTYHKEVPWCSRDNNFMENTQDISQCTVKIPKRLNTSVKHIGVFRAFVACLTSEYQLNTSLILLLNSKHNLNTYFNVCYNTMPILNTMQLRIKQAYVEGTFRPIQGLYHSYLGQHSPKRKVIIATTLVVSLLVTRLSSRRQLETFDCHNDELFEHDISSLF